MAEEPVRKMFQASAEARLLRQRLSQLAVGETITYADLALIAGLPVVDSGTSALATARRALLREEGRVIGCISGIGVVLLDDQEVLNLGDAAAVSIRRKSRRTVTKLDTIEFGNLPNSAKLRHSTLKSLFGIFGWMGREKQLKKLEQSIPQGQRALPIDDVLRTFRKS